MKSLLVMVLFIIVILFIYDQTMNGDGGLKEGIEGNGQQMHDSIQSLNP